MTKTVRVPIDTRYYQFDQQGVAFNMWYLAYLEDARNGFLAAAGFALRDLLAAGYDIQLVHSEIDWSQPIRYGDAVTIEVTPARVGMSSFGLAFSIIVDGVARVTASTVYVIVDGAIQGKRPLPERLRTALAE